MRILFIFFFISLSLLSISQNSTDKGLIAHYNFNRPSFIDSTIVPDQTGINYGKILGRIDYTADRYNNSCGALKFDGNTFISIPNSPSLQSPIKEITISVWFKLSKGADFFKQWITICCKSDKFDEYDSSPQYRMQATAQTISINSNCTKNVIPQLSYEQWYFYAYTFDGKNIKGYLDGQYFYEGSCDGNLEVNNLPLEIGRDLPGKVEMFYGVMDDLKIHNRALSNRELNSLYTDQSNAHSKDYCGIPKNKTTKIKIDQDIPNEIDSIPIDYQDIIEVRSTNVVIYPYDHNIEDGDVISINVNGVWVKENYTIKNKIRNPTKQDLIYVTLKKGDNNYIISKAIDEGKIKLNTVTYLIDDGLTSQKIKINSKIGLSGGIKIICK